MIKISAVSYLNTEPFIFGITNNDINNKCKLELDIPKITANKFKNNLVDIALIPVAALAELEMPYTIITNYCIGAIDKVGSVMLYSDVPYTSIKKIILDQDSRTSNMLIQILCKELWHCDSIIFEHKNASTLFDETVAQLMIGDKTFDKKGVFKYEYDLATMWHELTQLPFAFAVWVCNKNVSEDFISNLNNALEFGVSHTGTVIEQQQSKYNNFDIENYFNNQLSFKLDNDKKQAIELYLQKIKNLNK